MRKLFLGFCLIVLVSLAVAQQGIKAKYESITFELPKGSTVTITVNASGSFIVNGSTFTSYEKKYVVPRTAKEIGYNFDFNVSSQTLYLILHGELK